MIQTSEPEDVIHKIKILFGLFLAIFVISTLSFSYLHGVSINEGLVLTLETLAFDPPAYDTLGERWIQIFLMVFGSFLVWFTLWAILDIIIEGHFYITLTRWIRMKTVKHMKNHYIIYGGGRVGEHIADLLSESKKRFVIVENDPARIDLLTTKKYTVISGDIDEDQVLLNCNIKHAAGLIAVLPLTESNILLSLSAKEMHPKIIVYARANKLNLVNKLRKAGASYIIMPEYAGAELIVGNILGGKKQRKFAEGIV